MKRRVASLDGILPLELATFDPIEWLEDGDDQTDELTMRLTVRFRYTRAVEDWVGRTRAGDDAWHAACDVAWSRESEDRISAVLKEARTKAERRRRQRERRAASKATKVSAD